MHFLLLLVIEGHRETCASLALARFVDNSKASWLCFAPVLAGRDLSMTAIEDKVAGLIEVSCTTVAANWPFQKPVLSDQPVKLRLEVLV